MHWYKRDPDAALSGMAELNFEQRGAYNSLLDLLYSRDGDVPDDDKRVARMMNSHWRSWAALKLQLMTCGKVWLEGGKLTAKRVQDTLKEASELSQEQSRRASKGWQKRKYDNGSNVTRVPTGNASTSTTTSTSTLKEQNLNLGKARKQKSETPPVRYVQPTAVQMKEARKRDKQTREEILAKAKTTENARIAAANQAVVDSGHAFTAECDSLEFRKWQAFAEKNGKTLLLKMLNGYQAKCEPFSFVSQWPPDYEPNGKAP
jgi:uncharacterized protein YdaU (DUF1376 family)